MKFIPNQLRSSPVNKVNYRIEWLLTHKIDFYYAIHQYEKWELRDRDERMRESRVWSRPLADWMDARRPPQAHG